MMRCFLRRRISDGTSSRISIENGRDPRQDRHGFYFAMVPAALDDAEVDENLKELGIEVSEVYELSGWKTSSGNVAAAFVPYPPNN